MNEVDLTGILIHCPERGFGLSNSTLCFTCKYYNGIVKATERGEPIPGNEADLYQISCSRPITRKLIKVFKE